MDAQVAKSITDKIVGQIFGYQNPLSLEQFLAKFAFDIRLPQQVYDSSTNEPTWASSANPAKFISFAKNWKKPEGFWDRPKRPINSMQDILTFWNETNDMATERYLDSLNVAESDDVRHSENVYRSQNIEGSKNIVFTDGAVNNDYSRNIQIADLNALNAALAVIKWKKLFGFYLDLDREHHSTYTIDGNMLTNDDRP